MKLLKVLSMMKALLVVSLFLAQGAVANPLYSWVTKDGTPTYSPDPPPDGVDYVIVGPDLLPLQGQPVAPSQPAAATNPVAANNNVAAPVSNLANPVAAAAQITKSRSTTTKSNWKPVVYADDPNPQTPIRGQAQEPGITAPVEPVTAPVTRVSAQCRNIKQQLLLLESQFANAFSAQQMDQAIVRWHRFVKQNQGNCGL